MEGAKKNAVKSTLGLITKELEELYYLIIKHRIILYIILLLYYSNLIGIVLYNNH
jgi:hypothetical protein